MLSLEVAQLIFLALACFTFSVVYSFVDNHKLNEVQVEIGKNFILFFFGLLACGVVVNALQAFFG
ncbi:MAG: hypothetical protein KC646_06435 [Candidatus Cloacimonetes bacterium]|nr:hypothetical protein [Candidatus Cloacimonadota bacterium]